MHEKDCSKSCSVAAKVIHAGLHKLIIVPLDLMLTHNSRGSQIGLYASGLPMKNCNGWQKRTYCLVQRNG